MSEYAAILGHEPTEKTRKTLERLEALAQQLHDENPDLTPAEIWNVIDVAVSMVLIKRAAQTIPD